MVDVSKYSERIQKYLANELTANEMVEFEELVKMHSELQEEIQLYRKVTGAIADPTLENFKNDLDIIHNKNFGSQNGFTVKPSRQWYLIAALFLILITIASVFLFKNKEIDPQLIFLKYYQPLSDNYSRGSVNDAYGIAVQTFNSKNYNLAFEQFEEIATVDIENYSAKLYLGICGIELGRFSKAETQFKLIIESQDPFFIQDAEWYLALLYLKMEDVEKATNIFEEINKKDGMFSKNASLVLVDLN